MADTEKNVNFTTVSDIEEIQKAVKKYIDKTNITNLVNGSGISITTSGETGKKISTNFSAESPIYIENDSNGNPVIKIYKSSIPTQSSQNAGYMMSAGSIYQALHDCIIAGSGIKLTKNGYKSTVSAVLPTSDPGIDNVLYIKG